MKMHILNEILDKLNFLMAHIHLMVDDKVVTVMDLYQEIQVKEQKTELKSSKPSTQQLKEYAFKTGNFSINLEGNVEVKYINGKTYKILREKWCEAS